MTTHAVYEEIRDLFNELTDRAQVDILVELYYSMDDRQKDTFLKETENA
jgi:hypothetical protein